MIGALEKRFAVLLGVLATGSEIRSASAADYYVAPTGDDATAGTLEAPWHTLRYAAGPDSPVTAGDTIFVRAGTYGEYIEIGKSGADTMPIVMTPYHGEHVVLTGGGSLGNVYALGQCNWTIEGFEIEDSNGGAGIYWEDADCTGTVTLQDNVIHDTNSGDNASCIYLQRNLGNFVVRRNTLYDCDGTSANNSTGVVVFGHINPGSPGVVGLVIQNNEIYSEGVGVKIKHAFATDQTIAVDISYNLLHDLYGRSAIETAGGKFTANKTNRIHHNLAYDNGTTPGFVVGVDFDEYGVEIDHNTAYNVGQGFQLCVADGCDDGGSGDIDLHDNIFMPIPRSGTDGYAIWTEVLSSPFVSDYNCFWNMAPTPDVANWGGFGDGTPQSIAEWNALGFDSHSAHADPMFIDTASHDFHLANGSGCKNLRGDGTDAGAYEIGSETIGPSGRGTSSSSSTGAGTGDATSGAGGGGAGSGAGGGAGAGQPESATDARRGDAACACSAPGHPPDRSDWIALATIAMGFATSFRLGNRRRSARSAHGEIKC